MLENVRFEFLLDSVGEFHARMRKKLHAIVLKRIVRGGNHHAGLEIILSHQAGDARRGDNTCEGHRRARL